MNFSENLQVLRKTNGISQEQLAERLDVSRQAVSKWETDGGYPEMDKIIQLCDIFGVTMDELIKGKVEVDRADVRRRYENHCNSFAKGVATGVFLCIAGAGMSAAFNIERFGDIGEALGNGILLLMVAAAVAIFVIFGSRDSAFKRANPVIPEIYTLEEEERFNTKIFPFLIAGGILIIAVAMCVASGWPSLPENLSTVISLLMIAAAVWMFVYGGITHAKFNIAGYNRAAARNRASDAEQQISDSAPDEAVRRKKRERLCNQICSVIMLSATAIYLAIGFVMGIWSPSWAVFPVGGIACAIIAVILKGGEE